MNEKKMKIKKPFYKKWWVWLIAVIIIVNISTGDDEKEDTKVDDEKIKTSAPATDEVTKKEEPKLTEEEKVAAEQKAKEQAEAKALEDAAAKKKADLEKSTIKAGTYKVGSEIPAGEYLVFSDGMTYFESAKDSTGNLESIIFNDNLMSEAHSYVTLGEGEYFKLTGGKMYPVASAPSVIPKDGLYLDGMYKVGQDIPAGEYKVILNSSIGMGYLEVSSNSKHKLESIITNENVQADTYITVKDGQYLKLQGLEIQK